MSELSALAVTVARNTNWPVFPLAEDKKPAIPKREDGNGFQDASRDPEAIHHMFAHRRAALIGVPTGHHQCFSGRDRAWYNGLADFAARWHTSIAV